MLEVNLSRFNMPMSAYRLHGGELMTTYTYEDGMLKKSIVEPKRTYAAENVCQMALVGRENGSNECACYLDGICAMVSTDRFGEWIREYDPNMRLVTITAAQLKMLELGSKVRVFLVQNLYVAPEYRLQGVGHTVLTSLPKMLDEAISFHGVILLPSAVSVEYDHAPVMDMSESHIQKKENTKDPLAAMRLDRCLQSAGYTRLADSRSWWRSCP